MPSSSKTVRQSRELVSGMRPLAKKKSSEPPTKIMLKMVPNPMGSRMRRSIPIMTMPHSCVMRPMDSPDTSDSPW